MSSGQRLHEASESPMVSVRLVTADSYQAKPLPQLDPSFSEFRGSEIKHVPVIRIFGATADGEKTCLHVHGVFPYLFVPYTGEEDPQILAYRLAASLDAAINVSLGSATSNAQHVYCVQRVSGTPFYGYHRKEHQFFKVYFYNPAMIKRAADLLQNGSVLNQSLQPHEAHINYILQFMMDYNIYGMSFVNLREAKHRRVTQSLGGLTSSGQSVSSENSEIIYLPVDIERQSTCELEIDAHASDILNRLEIDNNIKLSPGLAAIWDEERARRAQAGFEGGDSQLVNPKSPSRPPFHPTDNDVYQAQRLARRLLMISQGDESSLSTASNRSVAYAAEVREGENLLNASRVPNVSVERIHRDRVEDSFDISSITDASMMPGSQYLTQDNSILEADDMPLVDLLAQLARENDQDLGSVDVDSLLGSQASVLQDEKDKIEQDDEDEEDVVDLNLTSLELDSLSLFDRASEKQELLKISETEQSGSKPLVVSPFLSPWESASCSPESPNGIGGDSEYRMPQYDGAGDASPSLFGSDDEFHGFSELKSATKVTDGQKQARANRSATQTPTNASEASERVESSQNSATDREVPQDDSSVEIADIPVAHYCVVGYEPFDSMLEMGNDLMPDFADMESSMEMGIFLSSQDSEKVESIGEVNTEQEIVLETVLNGDPCFTESAELDKSDVTELHDQYVSLMDNALLPDLPRIETELDRASQVLSNSCDERAAISTPDGYSSSENVAPNVQQLRGFPRSKSSDPGDSCEALSHKEQSRLGSDAPDFNCNVVATWAELQNLQIVDKPEKVRRKKRFRRFRAGPRSIKRRGDTRSHPVDATSQLPRENSEIITLTAFSDLQHSQSQDPAANVTWFVCGAQTITKKHVIVAKDFDKLSCTSKNSTEFSLVERSTQNIDAADEPQISLSDDRSFEAKNAVSKAKYSTCQPNDSFEATVSDDLPESSANDFQNFDLSLKVDSPKSYGTSFYCSKRSERLAEVVNRPHRHCVVSRANKIVQGHVFTTDELWIIHKKKRRRLARNRFRCPPAEALCTNKNCKIPIVFLEKIEQREIEGEQVPEAEEIVVAGENSGIVSEQVLRVNVSPENSDKREEIDEQPSPSMAIKTREKIIEMSKQRAEKIRRKINLLPAVTTNNDFEELPNTESSTSAFDTKPENPPCKDSSLNDLSDDNNCHRPVRLKRATHNTRRRSNAQKFVKQPRRNAKKIIATEDKVEGGKRTKEPKLPGIPGIPKKPRRSRNNVSSSFGDDAGGDGESRKIEEISRIFGKNRTAGETCEKSVNNASKKAQSLVRPERKVEISTTEQAPDPSVVTKSPISLVPKKNTNRNREMKNSSVEFPSSSPTPKKFEKPEQELTALSAMLEQAKSRSMRTQIKMLIRKRINEQGIRENNQMKFRIKTYPRKVKEDPDKRSEESSPRSFIKNEPLARSPQLSATVRADKIEHFEDSYAPSFESVTDADEMSDSNNVTIASLKNVKNFGDTTLVIEYSDPSTEIFDNEASVDSVIGETHDLTELNATQHSTAYDTDRYENAINEANFFAGKDYSIDAVSVEIPTCLFEEDSIPIDKHSSNKTNHHSVLNSIDTESELSLDPRDLDVYDVQSLTSSSSFSNLNETTDVSESLQEILHHRRTKVSHTDTSYSVIHEESLGVEIPNKNSSITIHEEDSIPEESPTFEPPSPDPQIDLSFSSIIQNEFTVQSEISHRENQNVSKDCEKNTGKRNAWMTVATSTKQLDSILSEYSHTTTFIPPKKTCSETPENSSINISRETPKKYVFSRILENYPVESTSKMSLGASESPDGIHLHEIEEASENSNSTENHLHAQIITNSRIEPEILIINENQVSIHTAEIINSPETNRKNKQFPKNTKKTEKSFLTASKKRGHSISVQAHERGNWAFGEDTEDRSSNRSGHEKVKIGPAKIVNECEKLSKGSGDKEKASNLLESSEDVTEMPENVRQLTTSCSSSRKKLSERLDREIPPSGILCINKFSQSSRNHPEKAPVPGKTFCQRSKVVSSSFGMEGEYSVASENSADKRENSLEEQRNLQTGTRNKRQEKTKSNPVDVNKNDVETFPKAEQDSWSKRAQEQTDCPTISMQLNPEILQEPKAQKNQESSEKIHETNTTDETFEQLVDTLNLYTRNSATSANPGILNISRKRVRKYRRKMSTDTKIPERRRSVRICAETTLESRRRASSSTSSTSEAATTEQKIANPVVIVPGSEGEEEEENVDKMSVSSTRLEVKSFVEASNPEISQELDLAEQSFMDENSAPMIPKRRGSRRKIAQTNSREISLPIITDENTAPIFGNSTRLNLRINVQESQVCMPKKSATKKNNGEKRKRPENPIPTTRNTHPGLTPSIINFPPSIVSSNNTTPNNIFHIEKNDESLMPTPKIENDSVLPIKQEFTRDDDIKELFGPNVNIITKIPISLGRQLPAASQSSEETNFNDPPVTKRARGKKAPKKKARNLSKNKKSTKSVKPELPPRKRGRPRKYPLNIAENSLASENVKNLKKSEKSEKTQLPGEKKHQRFEEFSPSRCSDAEFSVYEIPQNSQSGILIAQPHRSIESSDSTLRKILQSPVSKMRRQRKSNETTHEVLGNAREIPAPKSEQESEYSEESSETSSEQSWHTDFSFDEQEFHCKSKKKFKKSKTKKLSKRRKVLSAKKKVSKAKKLDSEASTVLSWQSQSLLNFHTKAQPQKPIIRLKRLSRISLKRYGIVYSWAEKKFVKTSFIAQGKRKKETVRKMGQEFQVPAYDGAADLSSSEEEQDQDVTIVKEEKRVCTYSSSKKSVSKGETLLQTPVKRKMEMESGASSPKRQALGTMLRNETKTDSLNSPNRTAASTLKTPGRNAAKYSPLKIIVTSPKVRKDIAEAEDDVRASTAGSMATTPVRKCVGLHDNLLRARINSVKSSLCKLGDERASAGKAGSKAVDNSLGEKKDDPSRGSPRIPDPGTMLKDTRDARKKLLFLDQHSNDRIDESSRKKVQKEGIKLTESFNDNKGLEENSEKQVEMDISQRLENSMAMDAAAGPSRCSENPASSWLCGIETQAESDEDVSDEDVCNVTFTQFIESQRNEEDATFLANLEKETEKSKKKIRIMPKFKPPSRERVFETMEEYGIPKFRNQEPFFSESGDVPKQKEVAHKILKVAGKGVEFLPQFVSSLEQVTGISRWRKMWLNEFHPPLSRTKEPAVKMALASAEKVLITPIALPPTQKQVKDWIRARDYLNRKKLVNEEPKGRAVIQLQDKVDETFVATSQHSSDSSVIEPSPERTLLPEHLMKSGNTTLKSKLAKRGFLRRSAINPETGSQQLNDSKDKSLRNSPDPDPSLLEVLQKSRLFRDQEASRHLGVSCGQIEFLSDSTRSNITNENLQRAKALVKYQYLTIMCLEIHVVTRGDLLPDAQHDPIAAIFYSVQSDVPPESSIKPLEHGVIVVADSEKAMRKMYYSYASSVPWKISFVNNEEALLNALVTLITRTDPEILMGWEIETLSWGYVFQRASSLGINLLKRVSRIPATQYKWEYEAPDIEKLAEVKLPGRIVLDIWRIMRRETALLSYTFESVIHHVLNERIPCPSFKVLTDWWQLEKAARPSRWRVVQHYSIRVLGILRILDQLDIIGRTSELARLFGIQFFEVFSRGSQFRVESVMLRLAKPLNYIAVSPSSQQRASMRAMEALPLILEPESMLYSDPLIVLDFQSLYPSIIIAHNLCFSTCLGRIEHIGQSHPFEFGAYTLRVPKKTALKLQNKVNFAPCGVAYVKPEVRLGILPRMLTEILETRFMVKKAMKDHDKNDKTLQRALHSRQMGLKFLANVTYGYTAANFSGRMPCIEVGDSVISKSKETLERAIKLVESTPKWGARVVYGDTDSLFILVPGKSKDEAFVIGNEIADAVTASNLPPIKLKFEKVLYPAILQTKKRYCGYMYETPDQETPTYLAKGIETVRRDGCPAVSKILEKTLKILFETKDVSLVKKYVTRQLDKVLRGKVSIQDLTFAKEFRGLKGYKAKACVPSLELTRRLMRKDPRAVPRTSERVRYVIVAGAPNQALIHCVRTPWELMADPGLRPNAIYYVTRVIIPPLNRCLNLMGVDVNEWYKEMPHRQILDNPVGQPSDKQKLTIFQYFGTIVCVACGQPSNKGICTKCLKRPADTLVVIYEKLRWLDRTNNHVTSICQSCVGRGDVADCASLDCPILYRRAQAERELSQAIQLREIIKCGNNLEF